MRYLLFILGVLFRQQKRVRETDYLGFEAFTRPSETNDSPATPTPAVKVLQKAA